MGEANGGSLFFDEIGRLPFDAQVALLRLLDEGEYKPLGAKGVRHSRFKLIGAMSGRLDDLMKDLAGRLCKIYLPRLVDRREDIPLLVRDYLKKTHAKCIRCTSPVSRRRRDGSKLTTWPPPLARQPAEFVAPCCSAAAGIGGGTRRGPNSHRSCSGSRRTRVAAQYLGASSR